MTDQTVSEVLYATADRIERDGWGKGKWDAAPGEPTCIEGAMKAVLGIEGRATGGLRACPVYVAMQRYLDTDRGLWIWNDSLPFTEEGGWRFGSRGAALAASATEVVETLRAAALIAAAEETDVRVVSPRVAVTA